jgi:asparagine synthase (glutamine-hydrolysing)
MSRIAGILTPGADGATQLEAMVTAMRSRAEWRTTHASEAPARLAWTGWHTPNVAAAHGVAAVVDGRIYNRDETGAAETDAAVVLRLFAAHGFAGAMARINGDLAVALYDATTATLWLGRDRCGVKPLYYAARTGDIAFASRPGALLGLPFVSLTVNRKFVALFAASHYRTFDNDPTTSPFRDIAQLPAGHVLRASPSGIRTELYWSLTEQPDFDDPEDVLAERYRELLVDAVKRRLTTVARPAFTLSGGMDSSSVLASAVRVTGAKQHAFSSVYDDKTYDETDEIRSMLAATVEEWHPVRIGDTDAIGVVERMIEAHDEPVATATWLSHFLLCGDVRAAGFGGVFGGLGGDELNAGEYEYFMLFFADLRVAGRETDLQREGERWIAYHDHPIFRKSFDVMRDGLSRLVDPARPGVCLPDARRLRRYASALDPAYFALEDFTPVMDHPFTSYLKNRTYQDMFRETLPCCLRALDRQTTAHGLDDRQPFLDHRLVEFMFRVPGTMKIRDGVTKHLLRRATRGLLPEETRTRIKKTGWNAPAHVWFSGKGREALMDLIGSRAFRERGIYDVQRVRQLIDEHERIVSSGRAEENHMMFLWQLVNLELWLRWLERRSVHV